MDVKEKPEESVDPFCSFRVRSFAHSLIYLPNRTLKLWRIVDKSCDNFHLNAEKANAKGECGRHPAEMRGTKIMSSVAVTAYLP